MDNIEKKYAMVINSLAQTTTGITFEIINETVDFYIPKNKKHFDAIRKDAAVLISKAQFDFFKPRTELMEKFLSDMDRDYESTCSGCEQRVKNCLCYY